MAEGEKSAKFWAVRRKGVRGRGVWDGAPKSGAQMGGAPQVGAPNCDPLGLGFRSLGVRLQVFRVLLLGFVG